MIYKTIALFLTTGGFPIYTGFGNGAPNQRIWLDNVQCDGTEQRLDACIANPIGQHNCRHVEDAGVVCRNSGMGQTG